MHKQETTSKTTKNAQKQQQQQQSLCGGRVGPRWSSSAHSCEAVSAPQGRAMSTCPRLLFFSNTISEFWYFHNCVPTPFMMLMPILDSLLILACKLLVCNCCDKQCFFKKSPVPYVPRVCDSISELFLYCQRVWIYWVFNFHNLFTERSEQGQTKSIYSRVKVPSNELEGLINISIAAFSFLCLGSALFEVFEKIS